ncbi:hypothetical protein [Iodobacter fluviatilis]|nr:hypothetical protein [Iodobacter fluviatilis]
MSRDLHQAIAQNEVLPLQARLMELNKWLGVEVIRFHPYSLASTTPG